MSYRDAEKLHDIVTEPDYTCKYFEKVKEDIEFTLRHSLQEAWDANKDLRNWGTEWKDRALEYYERIEELEKKLEELTIE